MEVYLIGNGFDLDLGIDSSYSTYYRSKYFTDLCNKSPIASYIKGLNEKDYKENWVDFEEAIKLYCINVLGNESAMDNERLIKFQNLREFEEHFKEIRNSIADFLSEQASKVDLLTIPDTKNSIRIAKEIVDRYDMTSNLSGGIISENNNIKIITFNYTNSLTKLIEIEARKKWAVSNGFGEKFTNNFQKIKDSIVHIHGSLEADNIILGIEDVIDIIPKETFIVRKSIHVDYTKFSLGLMSKANNVTIFGHSLGTSDEMYFKKLFTLWKQTPSNNNKRKITIYHKKDPKQKVYYNNRILELIEFTTSDFKEFNDYKFIEVS
jgi:hypothetical protein